MPLSRSVLDTQYASWPITTPPGVNILSDTAQVGFSADRWDAPDTWYTAQIVEDSTRYGDSTPRLRVLIGPANGGVTPGLGQWYIHGKITDNPEVPTLYLDYIVLR